MNVNIEIFYNIYAIFFAYCLFPIMDYYTGWNLLMSIPHMNIEKKVKIQ